MIGEDARFLLYAPNVHTGGGYVLLLNLLEAWPADLRLIAWLDARVQARIRLPNNANIEWVRPALGSRFRAECSLAKEAGPDDLVLCFQGLPPLFPTRAQLHIFQQNRNLLGLVPLHSFAWRTRQRLRVEQALAWFFRHRCASYWVQTPSMARELQNWYGHQSANIRLLPFSPAIDFVYRSNKPQWDFVYVADGETHKNHRHLIQAWVILAAQGLKPSLALTLTDRDATLIAWIHQKIAEHGLRISNLGHLSHERVRLLYGQSQALVFPSISESFGLPLIEASQAGLPIVASELDFVRDVCEPVQSFNPDSPVSIARAIRRFLGQAEPFVQPLSAASFISALRGESA